MISFVCNSSAIFLNLYEKPVIGKIFRFLPFFPYWAFIFNTNFAWTPNLRLSLSPQNDAKVFTFKNMSLISLLIQTFTYPFLFLYLKKIIRNEKGNKQSWLFFMRKKSKNVDRTMDGSFHENSSNLFNLKYEIKKKANKLFSCKKKTFLIIRSWSRLGNSKSKKKQISFGTSPSKERVKHFQTFEAHKFEWNWELFENFKQRLDCEKSEQSLWKQPYFEGY